MRDNEPNKFPSWPRCLYDLHLKEDPGVASQIKREKETNTLKNKNKGWEYGLWHIVSTAAALALKAL